MPYEVPGFEKIRDDWLRDIANQRPDADTGPDSDYRVRANAIGTTAEGLYDYQKWIVRQIFPDTADEEALLRHAGLRGIYRKGATRSEGTITTTGVPGSAIPTGNTLVSPGGVMVSTTADAVIDAGGTATVSVNASALGAAGNLNAATSLTFVSAPAGVESAAVVVAMSGGTDVESLASLLARLLDRMRNPPANGNDADYRRWAMSIDGITGAWPYPHRRYPGAVDVVVVSGSGVATVEQIASAQALIDSQRPSACPDVLVFSPTLKVVDVEVNINLTGVLLTDAAAEIEDSLRAYFDTLIPGSTCVKSQIEALISNVPGVVDRQVILPAANVTATVDESIVEWIRFGVLTVNLMP